MPFRTWPVAALALCALLLLIVLSVLEASRRAQEIYAGLDALNSRYHEVEGKLRRLRSDVYLSGIFVRDYLLDPSAENAAPHRARLADFRRSNLLTYDELRALVPAGETEPILGRLRVKLEEYWQVLDPLFDWTPAQKARLSAAFLRAEVIPRREAVRSITAEIEELNRTTMSAQRKAVAAREADLRSALHRLLWASLLLGFVVALSAVLRLRSLERRAAEQRALAQRAEQRMRKLSQQLVATQEDERKHLSRELHDHVGQVLTALRMELGSIDRLRAADDAALGRAVAEARQLVDNMVRTVRDLALGLRPSMLDDSGLQPALEWHVRDFTRRYPIHVELTVEGNLTALGEQHRICVYRIVQEALTNCVRHASAGSVRVTLKGLDGSLLVRIADDGVGMTGDCRHKGLGLRGLEERVRDLGGTFDIQTTPAAGTSVTAQLPIERVKSDEEMRLASATG